MPLTIKKRTSPSFAGKRIVLSLPGYPERTAPEEKQDGIPCRERIRKIFPCLLLGLIYFVKVK